MILPPQVPAPAAGRSLAALGSKVERSMVMDGGHFTGRVPMCVSVPDPHAMALGGHVES
jgi:hypothetical protein